MATLTSSPHPKWTSSVTTLPKLQTMRSWRVKTQRHFLNKNKQKMKLFSKDSISKMSSHLSFFREISTKLPRKSMIRSLSRENKTLNSSISQLLSLTKSRRSHIKIAEALSKLVKRSLILLIHPNERVVVVPNSINLS